MRAAHVAEDFPSSAFCFGGLTTAAWQVGEEGIGPLSADKLDMLFLWLKLSHVALL